MQPVANPGGSRHYSQAEILRLKTRWVPLFLAGAALLAAGGGILFVFAYRYLNALFDLTPRFFGFWERLPTRSLGLILGIILGIAGVAVTAYAADRIRASEIGQVHPFWWKIAIALFASRWWFRSPRLVVISAGENLCTCLRAIKVFTSEITALFPVADGRWAELERYFIALAENEEALGVLLGWQLPGRERIVVSDLIEAHLSQADGNLAVALSTLSQALGVHGCLIPVTPNGDVPAPALTALREADVILIGPGDLEREILPTLAPLADALQRTPAVKAFIAPITGLQRDGRPPRLSEEIAAIHRRIGGSLIDRVLANTNFAPHLPHPDLAYLVVDEAALRALGVEVVGRDLADWSTPTRHDLDKLRVWLQDLAFSP
jgi:2-phospho-L-lactate transferase/gluconeogenesis factor (CofD/UPF0052 family)